MKFLEGIAGVFLVVTLFVGLSFGSLCYYGYFSPRYQAIDREVFENTPSFVHGKIQYLSRLQVEYERADSPAQKVSLKEMILTEASVVDHDRLPRNLVSFLRDLENSK